MYLNFIDNAESCSNWIQYFIFYCQFPQIFPLFGMLDINLHLPAVIVPSRLRGGKF